MAQRLLRPHVWRSSLLLATSAKRFVLCCCLYAPRLLGIPTSGSRSGSSRRGFGRGRRWSGLPGRGTGDRVGSAGYDLGREPVGDGPQCQGIRRYSVDNTLQVDGYAGYSRQAGPDRKGGAPLQLAYCWAHCWRKMREIHDSSGSEIAAEGLLLLSASVPRRSAR